MTTDRTFRNIKLDERYHVEKPLLEQLSGLGWEIVDLTDGKQDPAHTFRENFTEVVMLPVVRERLKIINDWLEDDQIEEVAKQLTAGFPSTGLIENNQHGLHLLLENTSVSENRQTGEKSPTVRFIDFKNRDNNRFIAVCQYKVRIRGTEHHIIPDIVLFLNGLPVAVIECKSPKVKDAIPGANLDKGIPNAARIGYTGTPIDQTERVFGDYIDKYTMRQSIEDGVTLEIVYEGRTHNAEVTDQTGMDTAFADVFSEYNLQERLEILGYGSREAYLEAKSTIQSKAKDMIRHYLTHVFPNGYKAQVVAVSREAAVRYKTYIDAALSEAIAALEKDNPNRVDPERLKKLQTDVIISAGHNDLPHLKAYGDKSKHEASIKSFKLPFDGEDEGVTGDMGIVIVRDMLLTGFDAPVEQVMYLDKVVVAHNLLQAIARVNRVGGEGKDKGFVVDYVGIGHHLKKAIEISDEREQKDVLDALSFPEKELNELKAAHREVLAFFDKHDLTDINDHDAFFDLFYDEDLRFEYMLAFKKFTKSLNLVFPAKEALDFMTVFQQLSEINVMAAKHFRDERLSMKGIPPKLRGITDDYLESKGIDLKVAPISILDQDFESQVGKRKRNKTKAAEVEHAIRHHLDVDLDDDPDLQASFAEALMAIFKEFQDNWKKIYEELEKLRQRIIKARKEPTYGLHRKKQMPLFRMFRREIFGDGVIPPKAQPGTAETQTAYGMSADDKISCLVDLTQKAFLVVERELSLTGFWESIPARNKLKADLQKILLGPKFAKIPNLIKNRAHIISRIIEIAEKNNDTILYAE